MLQRKHIIIALIAFLAICVLYYLIVLYPRQGKIPVEVLANPENATIFIDNSKTGTGVLYLPAGSHTFRAEKEGWKTAEITTRISDDLSSVALVLDPASEEAIQQAKKETRIREGLSGIAANTRGIGIRSSYPILNKLPYSDTSGPFKIDYGFNQEDKETPYLIVSFSTPHGRTKALKWLHDNGTDLTAIEILFDGFRSPIYKEEDVHESN